MREYVGKLYDGRTIRSDCPYIALNLQDGDYIMHSQAHDAMQTAKMLSNDKRTYLPFRLLGDIWCQLRD